MDRKPLFDILRRILGRGFRQHEVDALGRALDRIGTGEDDRPSGGGTRQVSERGIALIKAFEGCARLRRDGLVEAYPDPGTGGAPWTIGWGATGAGIGPETVWTQEECERRLSHDLGRFAAQVSSAIGDAPASSAQFDALVSFHYNTGAIASATLTRLHVAGDHDGAAREFARWVHAGGKVMKGLVRRRTAESRLYSSSGQ